MSNTKKQAALELRRLSVQLRGLISLGDELDEIGSLEQAEEEVAGRLASLALQEKDSEARLAAAVDSIAVAEAEAAKAIDDARAQTAAEIEAIRKQAGVFQQAVDEESAARVKAARAAEEKAVTLAAEASNVLAKVNEEVTAREVVLDALVSRIEAVKKQISELG